MRIHCSKSKILPYNFTRKQQFTPTLTFDGEDLEVVYDARLLGVHISSDCRWVKNTDHIVAKASKKLWFLHRLKKFGASRETLIEIYNLFVRQNLELAAPLWTSSLTKSEINKIEKIQHRVTDLILGQNRLSYLQRLTELNMVSLEARRWTLTSNFVVKLSKDPEFKFLFPLKSYTGTRNKDKYREYKANTRRFKVSPIPSYVTILNRIENNK